MTRARGNGAKAAARARTAALLLLSASALRADDSAIASRLDAGLRVLLTAQREASAARVSGGGEGRARDLARRLFDRGPDTFRSRARAARLRLLVRSRGDCRVLEAVGFRVQAQVGAICTGTLDPEHLADLAGHEAVQFVRASQTLRAVTPGGRPSGDDASSPPEGFAPPVPRPSSPPQLVSGAGALVAFIDTGVDVHHQDFRKADGTTRIKYLLDLSDPGDVDGDGDLDGSGPYGGTLYTAADIDAVLQSGASLREKDTTGHGTHGLSVAAGDDSTFPGIAPAADLVVVKATRDDGTLGFSSTDVVNALVFVDQKAHELGLPYVVNLSLGTIVASHDGRSLEEQAIDQIVGPGRPGKVAVLAAGNSGDNRSTRFHHLGGTAFVGLTQTHTLTIPAYTANPGPGNDRVFLDAWYKGRDKLTITVTPPGGTPVNAPFGNYVDVGTPQGNVFIANLGGPSLENGDVEALVLIDDWSGTPPAAGSWTLSFGGEEIGDSGEYHAWLADDSAVGAAFPYLSANADNRYLVGKPGSAVNGITVGSFARHDPATRFRTSWTDVNGIGRTDTSAVLNDVSDFSSPGKTRDGRIKPEVTAPGERVLGAVSKDAMPGEAPNSIYRFHPFVEPTALLTDATANHAFGLLQGTSFSAPVVTGLAARILSTNPGLDAVQVRNVLVNSATTDVFTGAVPNDVWGYGKVDLAVGGVALPLNLRITTDGLPSGVLGQAYDFVLGASGGTLPYAWSLASGSLPSGLTLDATGHIAGTLTAAGTFSFSARVSDASGPVQTTTRPLSIVVSAAAALRVDTDTLPTANLGQPYDEALEAVGGTLAYSWALAGGAPPPGLSLLASGHLQGTPTELGRYGFTVRVTDALSATALRSVRLKVTRAGAQTWEPLGSEASVVNHVAVDPNDVRHLLASTDNTSDSNQNAVFESRDAGESWRTISVNNNFFEADNYNDPVTWLAINPVGSVAWGVKTNGVFGQGDVLRYEPPTTTWTKLRTDCGDHAVVDFDHTGAVYLFCTGSKVIRRSTDQGATWTDLGTLCGGGVLYGVGVRGFLSVARQDPNYMYVVRESGSGDYSCRSQDGGATWSEGPVLPSLDGLVDIQVSQTDPRDVVRGYDSFGGPDYVERSVDGGLTWSRSLAPASFTVLRRSPSDPAVLLLGSSYGGGPYKSTDHGRSWSLLVIKGIASPKVASIAFDPSNAQAFYVGTDQGLFYTADGGITWARKNHSLKHQAYTGLALSRAAPTELMLGTRNGYAYLTRTSGDKWTASPRLTPDDNRIMTPVISAADPNVYLAWRILFTSGYPYTGPLFVSEDRGLTWRQSLDVSGGCICEASPWDADPFAANNILAASATDTFYRSTDRGRTWSRVPSPSPAVPRDITFARDVPGRVYASFNGAGVFRSPDGGLTWQPYGLGLSAVTVATVEPAPSNSDYVYATTGFFTPGPVYYFDPAVGSWQAALTPPAERVLTIAVSPTNPLLAYAGVDHPGTAGGTGGLYRTTDGGRNWARLPGALDGFDVVSIAIHPTTPGMLYAATAEGGAYRSTDGGATWIPLDKFGTVGEVVNVTVRHPSTSTLLFAGTEGYGVQVSQDGGRTFSPRVTGLTNLNVNALAFEAGSPTVMYAATDGGLFKSIDTGNSWGATSLGPREITDLITDNDGVVRRIWATVPGQGVAYSADAGTTFTVYSSGLASLDLTSLELETNGNVRRIWATTRGGDGVSYSDDLGETWKSAAGTGLTNRNVNDFTYESSTVRRIWGTVRRIWATTDGGVFYSDNDGLSWSELNLGLPSGVPVTSVSIDPNTNEAMVSLFSDREGGAYRGGNLNGAWLAFNDGLDELKVNRLTNDGGRVVDAATKATTFYAATSGDGAFQSELRSKSTTTSPLAITTMSMAAAQLHAAYSQTLSAAGGSPSYTWSLPEGFLPAGLTLNVGSGLVSGQPGKTGTFSFSVQVKDAEGRLDRRSLSIVVEDPLAPKVMGFAPAGGKAGATVSVTGLRFTGATGVTFAGTPASFSVSSDARVEATVPPGATSGPIAVATPIGSGRSASDFLIFSPQPLYTLTPCRVVDTRDAAGPSGGPALLAGADRTFVLRGACQVPATAKAVSVNITVTQPTDAGDLRVFPAGTALPLVSSINYSPGQTRANNAILTLGSGGAVTVHTDQAAGSVHLLLDVNGYFQ